MEFSTTIYKRKFNFHYKNETLQVLLLFILFAFLIFCGYYGRKSILLSILGGIAFIPFAILLVVIIWKSKDPLRSPSKRYFMFNDTYKYVPVGVVTMNPDYNEIYVYGKTFSFLDIKKIEIFIYSYKNQVITYSLYNEPIICDIGTKNELIIEFRKNKNILHSYFSIDNENHMNEIYSLISYFSTQNYKVEKRHPFDNISQRFIISF